MAERSFAHFWRLPKSTAYHGSIIDTSIPGFT
jgi:hypothetical protein